MGIEDINVDVKGVPLNNEISSVAEPTRPKSLKAKILEVIWDGERSEEERKLVQRLDIFILYVVAQPAKTLLSSAKYSHAWS